MGKTDPKPPVLKAEPITKAILEKQIADMTQGVQRLQELRQQQAAALATTNESIAATQGGILLAQHLIAVLEGKASVIPEAPPKGT